MVAKYATGGSVLFANIANIAPLLTVSRLIRGLLQVALNNNMNWKVMEDPAMMGPVVVPRGSDSKAVRGKAILPEAVGHELE